MDQPTLQRDADAQAFLDAALDRILRAWADGDDLGVEVLARERPDLRDDLLALVELAREAALLRPQVLPQVPGYDVLREIGRGGMGIVYAARQHGLDRLVALKVLPDAVAGSDRARRRFLAEAKSLAKLRHPHVVTIFDVVEAGELCAYAMEWIDGKSLADLLEDLASWPRRGPAPEVAFGGEHSARLPRDPVVWLCRLGIAIARALGEVHRSGLVHRDVKPSNILLRADGTPLLSDFGVVRDEHASLTRTGQIVGTLAFAPPEQLAGEVERVGPASDVFALGATLHWALAGRPPFAGRTASELIAGIEARTRQPLTALGLPRDLETIVGKCLEPRIEDRYPSADAVAEDLENLLALRPITARPLGVLPRTVRLLRRNQRTVATAVASGILMLIGCVLLAWYLWHRYTLPKLFDAHVRSAQWALLEPVHEEHVLRADRGDEPLRATQFVTRADNALVEYARALDLMPERKDVGREREVVELARDDLRADLDLESRAVPAAARTHAPLPSHLAADRRLRGLHAFLVGDARTCHEAWADLDLAPGAGDPLVEAAAGQMYLVRDEAAKAYPRLLRAHDAWPGVGFLAVAVADCAVRLGEPAKAEQYLAVAEGLGQADAFMSRVRVRADLRAAQGRVAEARAGYESITGNYAIASQARLHYARLLEREGELDRAVELFLELVERQPDRARYGPRLWELAESWWASLPIEAQGTEVLRSWNTTESSPRLRRLAAARRALDEESRETTTAAARHTSPVLHRNIGSKSALPMEFAMTSSRESALMRCVPSPVQRLAAWTMLTAQGPVGRGLGEHATGSWLALRFGTLPCVLGLGWIMALFATDLAGQVQWVNRTPTSGSPSVRLGAAVAFDAARGQVLMYGGAGIPVFNEFWSWSGSSGTWSRIAQGNPNPGPRYVAALTPESSTTFLLFAGDDNVVRALNDTWRWNGTSWTRLTPTASPSVRFRHAMAYDSHRGVVVLFGGRTQAVPINPLADTWEWGGSNWIQRTPASSPPGVWGHAMTYDPIRRRVVMIGGASSTGLENRTWEWDGTSWTLRTPTSSPSPRVQLGMTWDAARSCAVVFGGIDNSGYLNDLWEWDGVNWTQSMPQPGPAPSAREGMALVYDSIHRQTVLFGGGSTGTYWNDTWILEPIAHADFTSTGSGCPGTLGTPSLTAAPGSLPWIGRTFTAEVTSIPNSFPYASVLFLGFTNPGLPLCVFNRCDCTLRTDLAGPSSPLAPTNNQATWSIPIPNDRNLLGYAGLHTQVAVLNFISGLDALSNGMQMTIGAR